MSSRMALTSTEQNSSVNTLSTVRYPTSGNSRLSNTQPYSTALLNQCVTPHSRSATQRASRLVSPKLDDALSRPTSRLVSTPPPYASFEHTQDRPTLIELGHKHRVVTTANTEPYGLPSFESGDQRRVRVTSQNKRTKKILSRSTRPNLELTVHLARRTPLSPSLARTPNVARSSRAGRPSCSSFILKTTYLFAGPNRSPLPKIFTTNPFTNNLPQSTPLTHGNQSADDKSGTRGRKFRHITSLVPHGDNL